jgi:two-component system, LytTR family, sensor kinase
MNEEQITQVRQRVHRLREFYVHVAIYVAVIGGLAFLNWIVSPNFWWVAVVAVAWGIGLAAHAISVFFEDGLFGREWEERKTREIVEREWRRPST